ncbi:DUF5106 domain-containing protein [Coprobacter tertius]|uniref:DUF5106 domain-containing protein n=1 Tax=Coprobacter tertius TaxID=2944915 RepID=A0ABT1MJP9_9BACT|nr:DUF5106 domain-containing protein [Coprobacter tertius]MCP9612835.1 DUF5106 domain-containing protein [Coprobacter tertius]
MRTVFIILLFANILFTATSAGETLHTIMPDYSEYLKDTTEIYHNDPVTKRKNDESKILDYIKSLQKLSLNEQKEQIKKMFSTFPTQWNITTATLSAFCEDILGDPDSPYYDDELYIISIEETINSDQLSDDQKIRPHDLLNMALKNRRGEKCSDFTFISRNGHKEQLFDIDTEFTILFFYDPDCEYCLKVKKELSNHILLNKLIEEKKLTILAVYPFGNIELWNSHKNYMPSNWIDAFNSGGSVFENSLYELRTMPVLFLLDKNKTVIQKNSTVRKIIGYIEKI